ncbi:MAG: amidohydrolase family protein [Chitinophagales bacterium]|nr:amidohydrolase family protein [Chitinophagales bacterium]
MKTLFTSAILLTISIGMSAQSVPTPAPAQTKVIEIIGGTVHVGNGAVMENARVVIEKGKIVKVEKDGIASGGDITIVDAKGKHIYPGFIAANTYLGLSEIDAVRATRDQAEVGDFNTNVRSIISYNTDSRVSPTIRSNGILLAQTIPFGGRISGTSSIVQMDAWNWEDAAYKTDDGIWMSWPAIYNYGGWWAEPGGYVLNKDYDKQIEEIRAFFQESKAYCQGDKAEKKNLKLEGMREVFTKKKNLFVRVQEAKAIMQLIAFKKEFDVQLVIVGGDDSWLVAKELAEAKIPVIMERIHTLPSRSDEDYDLPYRKPKILKDAGVLFCLSIEGFWQVRNLPFMAGTAAAYGLTKEEALASITSDVAKILGISDRTGTIEVGKDANILISAGDALDMKTSLIELAYIQGRSINLGNKQKDLYQKFAEKYKMK